MNSTALVMMIVVCGAVWGGFAVLLIRALRSESAKKKETG